MIEEQFIRILVRVGSGRFGTAEVNRVLVAGHDSVNRRVLPRAQTLETKLGFVIVKGAGDVQGEELRRDLANHGASVPQSRAINPTIEKDRRHSHCPIRARKCRSRTEMRLSFSPRRQSNLLSRKEQRLRQWF